MLDRTFLKNINENQFVKANKQLKKAFALKLREAIADYKMALVESLGEDLDSEGPKSLAKDKAAGGEVPDGKAVEEDLDSEGPKSLEKDRKEGEAPGKKAVDEAKRRQKMKTKNGRVAENKKPAKKARQKMKPVQGRRHRESPKNVHAWKGK